MRRRAFGLAVFVLAIAATPSAAPGGRPPALLTFSVNLGPSWASYSYEYRGLCVSRADGSNAFRLTGRRDDRSAAWSPDGTLVAFSRFYDRSRYIGGQEVVSDVFVLNPRSRRLLNVSDGEGVFNVQPAWSPDGRYIAFVAAYQVSVLMVVDLRTNRSWEIGGGAAEPVWSPDGQLIAFIDEYFVGRDPRERREGIFVVRPDGSGRRLLIPNGRDPAWSPDGRQIAYSVTPSAWYEDAEIAIANADGSEPRLLTQTPEPEADPAWSPDGQALAFTRVLDELGAIVLAKPDGSNQRVAVRWPGVNVYNPTWRPARPFPPGQQTRCPRR